MPVLLLTDGISLASVGLKLTAAVLLLPFYIETCTIQCFVLASTKRSKVDFFFSLVVHLLIIFLNTGPLFGKLMSIFLFKFLTRAGTIIARVAVSH